MSKCFTCKRDKNCPYQDSESEEQRNSPLHCRYTECNLYLPILHNADKLNQIEIPVIFDGEIMTYQCGKCGYTISCNYKDKLDLTDFMECLLAHDCYEIKEE